jgi:putative membrane protein
MNAASEPFLLLEPEPAPRLEAAPALLSTGEPVRWLRSPALAGVAVLGVGIPVLWALWLVSALFDRWGMLGWAGLIILVCGLGLIGVGMGRELRGLSALRRVDQLRVEFASGEAERVQRAARRWLQGLPQHSGILPALAAADTPETVLALLRSGPAQALQDATEVLGRTAALQSVAIIAATPSPAMDVLTVGWCGVRLIRQVAALHRMRPGIYGDAVIATEDGSGCGDGCGCGDCRERGHSRDGVASAIETLGRRCRRCRGGSPPHDRVGARSRSSLFTAIARITRPLRHQWT